MAGHRVVIQQLYEQDAHSSKEDLDSALGNGAGKMGSKTKLRFDTKTKKSTSSSKSKSTSVIVGGVESSKFLASPSKDKRRASAGTSSVRSSNSGRLSQKMTAKTALAMYGDQLTSYERKEILQYPRVYYLGLNANKLSAENLEQNGFDDDEHFYKAIPKDQIGFRFEIYDRPVLGKGTFGQVVKAYDHKDGRSVALKIVRNEKVYLKQSREELRILQVLRKQDPHGIYNVIHFYEFFMFRNHMVICFELLGMNLYQVLKRNNYRGLTCPRILPIARAVCKCLELLFRNRIIHCDIKPENIMLRRNGDISSVKVGDFGSSCYEQQQVYHYIQSRYYRAPEVILGIRYGPAIDMWSFGCVLAELVTGSPIFVGSDEEDQLAAIEEVIGETPKSLVNKAKSHPSRPRKRTRGAPGSKPLHTVIEGDEAFKDMMKKMFEIEPTLRPTPSELWNHPWLNLSRKGSTQPTSRTSSDTAVRKKT